MECRISAEEALAHAYLEPYHDPEQEPVCSQHVVLETDNIESLEPEVSLIIIFPRSCERSPVCGLQELKEALETSVTLFVDQHIGYSQPRATGQGPGPGPKEPVAAKEAAEAGPRVAPEEPAGDIQMLSAKLSAPGLIQDSPR